MKSRMSLIFAALVVILVSMVWVVRDRGANSEVAMAPAPEMLVQTIAAPAPIAVAAPVPTVTTDTTATPTIPDAVVPAAKSTPLVHVATDGTVNYTARTGDTVSDLAIALRGSDSKANRDAVIAANVSLQANPDRVLDGKTYSLAPVTTDAPVTPEVADAPAQPAEEPTEQAAAPAEHAVARAETAVAPAEAAAAPEQSTSTRSLKYIAQPGDNVAVLAASLLGGNTKTNRESVISSNASLQENPDHLVAGKTYNILATNGLAAAPSAQQFSAPSTQPDADEAARLGAGRVLRYTAQPGDTVSKLATVLLGSDTKANREAIISNNHSLQLDPDHLVAGKMYWIAAPTPVPVADSSAQ